MHISESFYFPSVSNTSTDSCLCLACLQAKHIEFDPIRAYDVTLPEGIVFVIANSLVCIHKYVDFLWSDLDSSRQYCSCI